MCLRRSSNCHLQLINGNRSGSVDIWHILVQTPEWRLHPLTAENWGFFFFFSFSIFFLVDASREWHMVKNKTTREKLDETCLCSLIWGSISERQQPGGARMLPRSAAGAQIYE